MSLSQRTFEALWGSTRAKVLVADRSNAAKRGVRQKNDGFSVKNHVMGMNNGSRVIALVSVRDRGSRSLGGGEVSMGAL